MVVSLKVLSKLKSSLEEAFAENLVRF